MRLGLLVNPRAGVGGRAGLKGSDDAALVEAALARGAEAPAPERAARALAALAGRSDIELVAAPGPMGEQIASAAGLACTRVGALAGERTSAADTRRLAAELAASDLDALAFAGGDGTAVDVLAAIEQRLPVVGIPSGVKMHSAVFALSPRAAGELLVALASGRVRDHVQAEVMDIDEEALQRGIVSPRLHGYLRVPVAPAHLQSAKSRSGPGERMAQEALAAALLGRLDGLVLVGPGTTTRALFDLLGIAKSVLGVDVLRDGVLVASDLDEQELLALVEREPARVIVTPVGGQGFLFGRGNQQLSWRVLRALGREQIVVVATDGKLAALAGAPLRVDSGDADTDAWLSGYLRVLVAPGREVVYPIATA